MERRQIRELIGRFLHNDVPGELQTQFRRWMLQPGDGDEKEAALREEWTAVVESPGATGGCPATQPPRSGWPSWNRSRSKDNFL